MNNYYLLFYVQLHINDGFAYVSLRKFFIEVIMAKKKLNFSIIIKIIFGLFAVCISKNHQFNFFKRKIDYLVKFDNDSESVEYEESNEYKQKFQWC